MTKDKITFKFQSLNRVFLEDTKGFSGRSRNGPLMSYGGRRFNFYLNLRNLFSYFFSRCQATIITPLHECVQRH